jgi:hypothetical protein
MYLDADRHFPHENECPDCLFLGAFDGWDLYYCEQRRSSHPVTVVLAVNPNVHETPSMATERWHCESNPVLAEALRRAKEMGWTLPDRRQET